MDNFFDCEKPKRDLFVVILMPFVFCCLLSLVRVILTRDKFFLFLGWNLILALVPLLLSIIVYFSKNKYSICSMLLIALWLLFFPNAPYIITDFIHLRIADQRVKWFDLVLLMSYATAGLFYGFLSLQYIERNLIKSTLQSLRVHLFSWLVSEFILGGFYVGTLGIYLQICVK